MNYLTDIQFIYGITSEQLSSLTKMETTGGSSRLSIYKGDPGLVTIITSSFENLKNG